MPAFRTKLATTLTTVGLALVAAPLTPATAAPSPAFLNAAQMPASSTPWSAGRVTTGLPEGGVLCAPGALPGKGTSHRTFRTELDTGGLQITTVAASTAKAAEIVTTLRRALATCAGRIEQQYPTTQASSVYHGKLAVEEGAYVYSLDTEDREAGSTDINLFSVGRDGRTVTYVQWGRLGDLEDAPLKGFKATTRTAVKNLYR
ncbi:hypothetical protein J7I98_18295 [Streptomyces sp. ISL-98]|uniref:hypothetical protein n=1 Tax=Streptomyces sp. ISL-98 TaxID=2819192 RepID=UPI001BE70BD4|nr:hypothetical protein [Streptomyces sp. ISL-98]MBT2507797.1 hypothetical protein [Streptomyces sp. ISL-98]